MNTEVRPDPKQDPEAWRAYWNSQIAQAQEMPTYEIGCVSYPRVPYGQEASERYTGNDPCRDCGVTVGQLHVASCCLERCPVCDCQAISCQCDYAPNQAISEERAYCAKKLQEVMATQKSLPIIPTPDNRWW